VEVLSALKLEYPFLHFVYVKPNERLYGATLIYNFRLSHNAEWMPVDVTAADHLKGILTNYFGGAVGGSVTKKTWFSRGGVRVRAIKNATEIDALCAAYGFNKFIATSLNFREQFQTFQQSSVILGVHGAGLANILFCRPGTTIVEIFPRTFIKSTYLWLARRLNCEYIPYIAGDGDYWQRFSLDARDFEQRLAKILR